MQLEPLRRLRCDARFRTTHRPADDTARAISERARPFSRLPLLAVVPVGDARPRWLGIRRPLLSGLHVCRRRLVRDSSYGGATLPRSRPRYWRGPVAVARR